MMASDVVNESKKINESGPRLSLEQTAAPAMVLSRGNAA